MASKFTHTARRIQDRYYLMGNGKNAQCPKIDTEWCGSWCPLFDIDTNPDGTEDAILMCGCFPTRIELGQEELELVKGQVCCICHAPKSNTKFCEVCGVYYDI